MTIDAPLLGFLHASSWMAGLTPAQIGRLEADTHLRRFAAGASVCLRGSPASHWLGVVDGMLKVETSSPEGRSTTFAGVPAGAWFGEGVVLKGEPRPYAVTAIRDSSVAFVPRATFQWLIDNSHPFSRWVINQLNARLGYYVALVENHRLQDASARVAYCLSALFNPHLYPGTPRSLAISQDEIAKLTGMARQNTNRALHVLEESGLLRVGYGVVDVLDLDGLQRCAHGQ